MITKEQAFSKIFDIASTDFTHANYQRTVDLKRIYKALITGEGAEFLLKRFNLRENEEQFTQRHLLTQIITPAICSIITNPTQKLPTVKPLIKEAKYFTKDEKNQAILDHMINNFWGDQSVDEYLRVNFLAPADIDPNSFMIVKFKDFDGRFEKPEVYATTVDCESVVDFEYANNILQYLAIRKTISYLPYTENPTKQKLKPKDGFFYQMYSKGYEIELNQVDDKMVRSGKELVKDKKAVFEIGFGGSVMNVVEYVEGITFTARDDYKYYMFGSNGKLFEITFYNSKTNRVPAIRTGVNLDPTTNNKTCVNQFHTSLPYLLKTIKTVSELDLSQSLHVFLQKFTYAPKCLGYMDEQQQQIDCNNGYDVSGNKCKSCGGYGVMVHTSGQDHIILGLPNDPARIIELSKLVHYADIPIDIVKWLDEYLDGLASKAVKARFGSSMFVENSIVKTATEKTYDMDAIYDANALQASQYSRAWILIVRQGAEYKDISKELYINHVFPQDWKMETAGQRMARLKEARDAGASQYTIASLQNDLMDAVYADQPYKLKEFNTMQYFNPFADIPDGEVKYKISQGMVLEYDNVLYSNLKRVMLQAYKENDQFYFLSREAQTVIVEKIVNDIIQELKVERLEKQAVLGSPFNSAVN